MLLEKRAVVSHLDRLLAEKLATCAEAMDSIRNAFASDTKSSAGDKHEVGRAMVQQELDKLHAQRINLLNLQEELRRVPLDRIHDRVGSGSLVRTDHGTYFIAIGLGAIEVAGGTCFAVSLASPIGRSLKDKRAGEEVVFNGKRIVIEGIV